MNSTIKLAEHQAGANDLALHGGRVYWTNFTESGAIMSVALAGGDPVTLVGSVTMPGRLCLGNGFVYWTSFSRGTVHRIPLGGGAVTTLATGQNGPAGCAFDGTHLVWTNFVERGAIMSLTDEPQAQPVTLSADELRPSVAVVRGAHVYWVRSDPTRGAVVAMPVTGGEVTVLASQQANPYGLAIDDQHAYWTNRGDGTVNRVPLGGGQFETIARDQTEPIGIAVDREFVYWTNFGGGTVMRASLAGQHPQVLDRNQRGPRRIAVDETHVYWTNYESGSVMKTSKRRP